MSKKKLANEKTVGLIKDSFSPEADAIIRLQTNIEFASADKKVSCYAITSPKEKEGKTITSCNLAKMYAEKGASVVLVDLDLRKPSIHNLFGVNNEAGVVEYVKGEIDSLDKIIHHADGIDIVTAGTDTPFPAKILSSDKLKELISLLKGKYEYVLIDTPAALVVSDAFLIGREVDGFLVVCAQHISKKKDVVEAVKSLKEKHMNVLGIAMDMVTTDEDVGKGN